MLARQLYDSIKAEPSQAAVVYDGQLTETKLVKSTGFMLTPAILERGVEEIARKVAESVGVEILDLVIESDKVISYHLKGGEVFNCEVKEGRALSEKLEKQIKKIIPAVKKANTTLREKALAEHRKYTKTDRLIEALIMPIVNHVGSKRAEWEAEQKRIQDDLIAAEAEKKRLAEEQAEKVRLAILAKMQVFAVDLGDELTFESIVKKRLEIENTVVDALYGEFEQQAYEAKSNALEYLLNTEHDFIRAQEEADKQELLDKFTVFSTKCEALYDDTHSVEYLDKQRFKLTNVVPIVDVYQQYYDAVCDCRYSTLDALDKVLIPAAKQRALDLAEKLNAEAEQKRLDAVKSEPVAVYKVEVKPLVTELLPEAIPAIVERIAVENTVKYDDRSLSEDILAMYAAMNPVLHAKVVEAAGKVTEYQVSDQKASFLHRLFDDTKQGKDLKTAFFALVK
jgi:predicted RecB family endonuclease